MKTWMNTHYDHMLKEVNMALCVPGLKYRDGIRKIMAGMPEDEPHRELELHTLEDMRWNDNHQCPIKYWSWHIITSMRRF